MVKCCSDEWDICLELPFRLNHCLIFDYYDGPLEGVAVCSVCGQCYYYKLLAWNIETQNDRVFEFIKIECSTEFNTQFMASNKLFFEFQHEQLLEIHKKIVYAISFMPVSHLCKSDDHFRTGKWNRKN